MTKEVNKLIKSTSSKEVVPSMGPLTTSAISSDSSSSTALQAAVTELQSGDSVKITKHGAYEGRVAVVANPDWNSLVKVVVDGTTKSYKLAELVIEEDSQTSTATARQEQQRKQQQEVDVGDSKVDNEGDYNGGDCEVSAFIRSEEQGVENEGEGGEEEKISGEEGGGAMEGAMCSIVEEMDYSGGEGGGGIGGVAQQANGHARGPSYDHGDTDVAALKRMVRRLASANRQLETRVVELEMAQAMDLQAIDVHPPGVSTNVQPVVQPLAGPKVATLPRQQMPKHPMSRVQVITKSTNGMPGELTNMPLSPSSRTSTPVKGGW
jgi:hypothetical protein